MIQTPSSTYNMKLRLEPKMFRLPLLSIVLTFTLFYTHMPSLNAVDSQIITNKGFLNITSTLDTTRVSKNIMQSFDEMLIHLNENWQINITTNIENNKEKLTKNLQKYADESSSEKSSSQHQLPKVTTDAAASIGQNILKYINRENVLQQHHSSSNNILSKNKLKKNSMEGKSSTCPSCQRRERAKIDNLESIKMHILMRLKLPKLPNITNSHIQIPDRIIQNFYEMQNKNSPRNKGSSRGRVKTNYHRHSSTTMPIFDDDDDDDEDHNKKQHNSNRRDTTMDHEMQNDDDLIRYSNSFEPINEDLFYKYDNTKRSGIAAEEYEADYDDNEEEEQENYMGGHDLYDEDDFFSKVNSIYVFPTASRSRHNKKSEILNFKFPNNHTTITRVMMHVYIRGREWVKLHNPSLLQVKTAEGTVIKRREIVITVHRALRRTLSENFTHTLKLTEFRHRIPSGMGQWVQIEVKQLSTYWSRNPNATLGIIISGLESWMKSLIVTVDSQKNMPYSVHLEVLTKDVYRSKRSTTLDCQESDNEVRCCRYPLKVNFTSFGWTFVVAPTSFDAYFCNGECKVGYLEQTTHTHITSLSASTSATPCCSPIKMKPLSLLYFNLDQSLVLSTIPNMSVEKCSCS